MYFFHSESLVICLFFVLLLSLLSHQLRLFTLVTGVNENYSRKINALECVKMDNMSLEQGKNKGENEVEVEGKKNVEKKAEMNAGAVPSESPFIIFTGKKEQNVTVERRKQKRVEQWRAVEERGKQKRRDERRGVQKRGEQKRKEVKRTELQKRLILSFSFLFKFFKLLHDKNFILLLFYYLMLFQMIFW